MSIAKTALKGVTFHNPLKADDGYTLFAPFLTTDVWLIDMEGHLVHRWRMPYRSGGHGVLLPNGNLLITQRIKDPEELGLPAETGGLGGMLMEVDWESNLIWKAVVPYQWHDFQLMENGHIMFNSIHPSGILPDEVAARMSGGVPGTEWNGKIMGDCLFEIDRTGKTVWEWRAYEHFDPEIDASSPLDNRAIWPYINSLWICKDGNLFLSVRYAGEAVKIEYPSGKIIGRYGRGLMAHQHDCRELENGNILAFDNGAQRLNYDGPAYSQVVEIDPKTDVVVWAYRADPPWSFYVGSCSGSERLPNGNTLICESWMGRIFEVSAEGEIVWEYISPFVGRWESRKMETNLIWRAHRYSRDYPGFTGKDLGPHKLAWENQLFGPDAFKKGFSPCFY